MADSFNQKNKHFFLNITLIVVFVVFIVVSNSLPFNDKDGFPFDKIDIVNETISLLTNNVSPCKYYEIDNLPIKNLNSVSFIHINIRSQQKKFDSLQEFMCLLPKIPEVICLTESRIKKDSLVNIELPDFKLFRNDSVTRTGGVAVYVADTFNAEIILSLYLDITGCENIWLKMNCLNIVFGVIYRLLSNCTKLFLEQLNKSLELLDNAKLYLLNTFACCCRFCESNLYTCLFLHCYF